jgi:hypothetical protein
MRDIKKTKSIITSVQENKATVTKQAGFSMKIPKLSGFSVEKEVYVAAVMLGVLVVTYTASMIGITVFAVQEKNYSFKTDELRSQQNISNNSQSEDALALAELDVHKDRMTHIYIQSAQMMNVSQR